MRVTITAPRRLALLLAVACLWPAAAAARQAGLTVDAPPALARLADRVRAMDPDALERPLVRAGLEMPARVHITLIPDDDVRARATPRWVVGQAFGSNAIIIFPDRISSYPYDSLESVVLHEIVHLALNARAGGRPLPRWFHEGVAVSVESGWGLGSQVRLLLAAGRGPALDDVSRLFRSESQPDTMLAYLLAAALVEDIRQRHGPAAPGAIAGLVSRGEAFDQAFLLETGVTVDAAAAAAWSTYRGWRRWMPIVAGPAGLWSWILLLAFIAFVARLRRRRQRRRQWDEEEALNPED